MMMMMIMMDDWCCENLSGGIARFRGWTVDQVGGGGGGGVGHSIVLRFLVRMNVCVHQSLSRGWKIDFVKLV